MNTHEELTAVCYDEINLCERGNWDSKYDLYIPPYKEANIFFSRSIVNKSIKMPVYVLHDSPYTKPKFMEIISVLESLGLKLVSQTCDQGTKNNNLSKNLQITKYKVTFLTPSGQEMVWIFDWVHEWK